MNKTFKQVILFVTLFAVFFAVMDVIGYRMWSSIGGWEGMSYITARPLYMQLFWTFAKGMILAAAVIYYILKKDVSETLAIVVAGFAAIWSGLEDVFYYVIMGLPLDQSMPWLNGFPTNVGAQILGLSTVTPFALILNIILFETVACLIIKWLYKQKW